MPPAFIFFFKKWGYYCTWREDTEGIYLGRLLHLISNIDLAELLKEAEHGKLQLLVPSLRQPRVREVHQLQHPGEGREKIRCHCCWPQGEQGASGTRWCFQAV